MTFTIYSDAGSFNNGKKNKDLPVWGSAATIILDSEGNTIHTNVKVFPDATNNFCELYGSLYGLVWLTQQYPDGFSVRAVSDSQYVVKGANEWIHGWKKRGWKNNEGVPTKNRELWEVIDKLNYDRRYNIKYDWVRGHQGKSKTREEDEDIYFQEQCDSLAVKAIKTVS